nr:hypothetical protein [Tanacetum cinerariifolium]
MVNLEFYDTYNMVAYLEKPEGSEGFHQIVDFLNASHIRASEGYTRVDIPLFLTMLVQCPIVQGEGSTVPVESHHTPTSALSTSQPHFSLTFTIPIRQETKVPQPSSPPHTNVADEVASTGVDVKHRRAATTVTRLDYDTTRIVVSNDEDDLEDSSKQGRKIAAIDQCGSLDFCRSLSLKLI